MNVNLKIADVGLLDAEVEAIYKYPSTRISDVPVNHEAEHYMRCNICSQFFDMRDLEQVCYHEVKGKGHKPKFQG